MESDVAALMRRPGPGAAQLGLRRLGRHVERAVLARAVGWHLEDRVIVYQNSTIVFS